MECRMKKFKLLLSNVTVEPIVFCNFLAIAFFRVAEHAGIYQIICAQNYEDQFQIDCKNLHKYPRIETMVQQDASLVNMYLSLAYMVPSMASDMFLGAWGDRYGRQVNILIGFAGLLFAAFPYTISLTYPRTPLVVLIFANLVAGFSGYIAIIMISSWAYLADIVPDKTTLTVRMARVFVFNNLATAIGSFASGSILMVASLAYIILLAEIFLAVGFLYTMLRIKHVPPVVLRRMVEEEETRRRKIQNGDVVDIFSTKNDKKIIKVEEKATLTAASKPESVCEKFKSNTRFIGQMYKDVWHTFTRVRPGHRRCYLQLLTFVYLLFFIAEFGLLHGPILSLYVFHEPFSWKPRDLAFWKGTQSLFLMLGNLIGSSIIKNTLRLKDTTAILLCLISGVAHLTMLAFCQTSWQLYLAVALGLLGNMTIPSTQSFIAQLVDADEVGKAFTANGVTADLAFVLSALFFNNIYYTTVSFFAGFVFIFASLLLLISCFIVLWIHIDKAKTEPEKVDDHCEDKRSSSIISAGLDVITRL